MTSLSDGTIAALRTTHDDLAGVVGGLTDEQLGRASGSSEWSVAQVLSHLGSGAAIGLATLRTATGSAPAPGTDANQQVWDRWNAMTPNQQASGSLAADGELVAAFEALTAEQREALRVTMGFLPAPLPLAGFAGMRLNEAAQHSWDVRVSLDPAAALAPDAAALLAEHFAGDLGFLLGFTGKADQLAEPAVVDVEGSGYAVVIKDSVALVTAAPTSTATFTGPLEAAIRLFAGRLTPGHTPAGLEVTGLTLDDLRRVFPGY